MCFIVLAYNPTESFASPPPKKKGGKKKLIFFLKFQSTTSTDRLLNSSTGSGLSQSKTAIGAHVLHSIPPKTSSKSNHRPYHQTTTSTVSKHAKYDKVPTQDNLHQTYDINSKKLVSKVPKFYKVLPQTSVKKNDDMGIDSKSQMKQNMSQIFSMEEPIKPNKDLYVRTRHDESIPIKDRNSIWPQVSEFD